MQPSGRNGPVFAPESAFLLIGLIAGVLFIYALPPAMGADEGSHFHRAVQVSRGVFLGQRQAGQVGGYLPASFRASSLGAPAEASSRSDEEVFFDFRNTVLYSPAPYLPHALALAMGRFAGLSPLALFYLARVAGLAVAIAIVWSAIRTAPMAKWLFVALALSPMAIRQMSSISADSITNAAAFFFVAVTLRLSFDPKAAPRGAYLAALLVSAVVLSLSKQGYLPLLALFFLCPVAKFGGYRRYVAVFVAIATLCVGLQVAWLAASRDLYLPQAISPDADPQRQLSFLLAHPARYAHTVLLTLWMSGSRFISGALGYGGLLERPFQAIHLVGLTLLALSAGGKSFALELRAKALLLFTVASTSFAILTISYLGWNDVGSSQILHVQGRYFIPLLPLGFLLLSNDRFHFLSEHRTAWLATALASGSGISLIAFAVR